jgi:hypothetical protein
VKFFLEINQSDFTAVSAKERTMFVTDTSSKTKQLTHSDAFVTLVNMMLGRLQQLLKKLNKSIR